MEVKDLIEKANAGELQCTSCGASGVSLNNVRVGMKDGVLYMDPSAYGLCKKCGNRIAHANVVQSGTKLVHSLRC